MRSSISWWLMRWVSGASRPDRPSTGIRRPPALLPRFGAGIGKMPSQGPGTATKSLLRLRPMRICLLGATGLVGREMLDLVARAWPGATLSLYASRDQELEHGQKRFKVEGAPRLEEESAPKGDLAFVALDDDHSKRYVPRLQALG